MFAQILFLLFAAHSSPFLHAVSATPSASPCPNSLSHRSCRLCGDLFSELQPTDCCGDPVLGALCQSFIQSLSANDKRYFVGKRNSGGATHGRVELGKKNRNTFLGKRFLDEAVYGNDEDALADGGAVDGLMTSAKRQRNNFLGKRVVRSAEQQRPLRDEGRISRLIKQFVNKLAAELVLEKASEYSDGAGAAGGVQDGVEVQLEKDWTDGVEGKSGEMEREQRAKNTFLG